MEAEKSQDGDARECLERLLESTNPAVRLWAATGLADLPSRENVQSLMRVARQDPVAIVRCKAIFALSHQGERRVVPFLEGRLKGEEDWYVKHYLLRGLRGLGWAG
jgi:HEAT repeat protein